MNVKGAELFLFCDKLEITGLQKQLLDPTADAEGLVRSEREFSEARNADRIIDSDDGGI